MQPFSPYLIIAVTAIGLALGVFAVVHQPGIPQIGITGSGNNTAQALEPISLKDTANMKLYNN